MHHRSARPERAIIVIQLNKYESRDHITEQVKLVVPRKGKGVKKKKGKKRQQILYRVAVNLTITHQSYKFNILCICSSKLQLSLCDQMAEFNNLWTGSEKME